MPDVVSFCGKRMSELIVELERIAAGELERRLPISDRRDELDALAYGINVLVGELDWRTHQALSELEARAQELQAAVTRAEKATASKNAFFRNVSHEIRTPIAAVLGFADLLASPDLSVEDRSDLVERLRANGQAVLTMLGDVLDLARLDADKITLAPEPLSLPELARGVLADLEVQALAKRLELRLEERELPGLIVVDPHRLRQILVNLVANAVKFTEEGSVVVSLSASREGDGWHWIVDVTDTGIGIPRDRQASVFEPFEQVDASITQKYGGTGLGLTLARRLAERLCGNLSLLRSEPGEGATFRLTLDAPTVLRRRRRGRDRRPARLDAEGLAGLRILLVEDHDSLQHAVRRMLEQVGASVQAVHDGSQAVETVRSESFDVVLMDLRMPGMDGLEATRILRREGHDVPVLALTADPDTQAHADALEAGCDLCLSKPVMLGELSAGVRKVLDGKSNGRSQGERSA